MKINQFTVDSSVLISMLVKGEANYADSKTFINFIIGNNGVFVIPTIVLFELFHTLKRQKFFDLPGAHEAFLEFCNYSYFKYFDLNMYFFNLFKQVDCFDKLKTSDAIIAGAAFLSGSTLISWDKKIIENCPNAYTPKAFLKKFA